MNAAVVNFAPEKGSVEVREIPTPEIGPDDVLLEVANVGVCGSDLHQWTADHSWPVGLDEFGGVGVPSQHLLAAEPPSVRLQLAAPDFEV